LTLTEHLDETTVDETTVGVLLLSENCRQWILTHKPEWLEKLFAALLTHTDAYTKLMQLPAKIVELEGKIAARGQYITICLAIMGFISLIYFGHWKNDPRTGLIALGIFLSPALIASILSGSNRSNTSAVSKEQESDKINT
jgi:hypothetical protein